VPGVTVAEDVADALPNVPATPAVDITSVSVAEPYSGAPDDLVFTLQVGEAATAPPTTQWYILWNRPTPSVSADRNYVAAKTSATGAVSYEYGTVSPPNANLPTRLGAANDGSYDPTTGVIRIRIANSLVDGVAAGQTLTTLTARTFSRPDGLPITQTAAQDFLPSGVYNLVGNESCRPNAAPTATLSRTPDEGCAPLTVELDGSPSSDTDAGDTIASYQFSFGDGTPDVVQSTPTILHTYAVSGDFAARLRVTDSRGKSSVNVDQKTTLVEPCAIAEIPSLTWSASKDGITWSSVADADTYRVYRGVATDFPALLDASLDACIRFESTDTSTGPVLTEIPPAGSLYWYLTIGVRATVEGSAGSASAGPRVVDPTGACP
jgi:PKD repeat protein